MREKRHTKRNVCALAAMSAVVGLGAAAQAAPSSYATAVLSDNPLAYYRLGEASGTVAADQTGNHPGTYVDSPVLGVAGAGVNSDTAAAFTAEANFASPADYMIISDGLGTFGSQVVHSSTEFVFKTESPATGDLWGYLDDQGDADVSNDAIVQIILNNGSAGNTSIWYQGSGDGLIFGNIDANLYDGQYHQLVATYDQTGATETDRLKVYVDGAAETVAFVATGSPSNFRDLPFGVGVAAREQPPFGNISDADATIDEAAFYTHVLSAADVQSHFSALVPEPTSLALLGLGGLTLLSRRRRSRG